VLACARRYRTLATWLFVLLIGLVAGERRLAEAHFNLRSAAPGLESNDALDGDEIRVRLIVLNDDKAPTIPDVSAVFVCDVVRAHAQRLDSLALGRPAPRGPPLAAPSRA
jgi:hypothetical protein